MAIQARFDSYDRTDDGHRLSDLPSPPADTELAELIAPNWTYDFDVEALPGIHDLRVQIRDAEFSANPTEAWSHILGNHITYGNEKLADHIAIFNMKAAHDCINLGTDWCQVDADECYAVRSENNFPHPLSYRRKQEIIWSHLDAHTWAGAFRLHYNRKRTPVSTIRFNEGGDFETRHDLLRVNEIARQLSDIVDVFTYSASAWLEWSEATHFTVNRSNDHHEFGARRFEVVDTVDDIPDGGLRCPHDHSDGAIHCGDCRICIDEDAPDVYVKIFN